MALNRTDLLKRIRRWKRDGKKIDGVDQPLTYLQILHVHDAGQAPVDGFGVTADTELEILVKEVIEAVETDAAGHRGETQKYYLCAYYGEMSPESLAYSNRYPISIFRAPDVNEENQEITGGDVSPKGLLASNQRHLERVMQMTLGPIETNNRSLQRQVETLTEENEKLRSKVSEYIEWYETTRTQDKIREIEERKYAFWEEKKEQIAMVLLPALPAIIGALIKKPNAAPSPELIAAREVFKTIKPEQWDALVGNPEKGQKGILSMQQSIFFQATMKQFMEAEDKEEEAIAERRKKIGGGKDTKKSDDEDDLD